MLTEAESDAVRAEIVALQAVLMAVFRRLATDRPELGPLFCQAFDEAETILSGVTEKMGPAAPPASTIGALKVVDELRRAVISDEAACKQLSPRS